jgi:hypothetical protein
MVTSGVLSFTDISSDPCSGHRLRQVPGGRRLAVAPLFVSALTPAPDATFFVEAFIRVAKQRPGGGGYLRSLIGQLPTCRTWQARRLRSPAADIGPLPGCSGGHGIPSVRNL